jgi:hypothetical protein
LKAPGTRCLKVLYDELLSNVAFEFNLRRYIKDLEEDLESERAARWADVDVVRQEGSDQVKVRRCSLTPGGPHVDPRMTSG